MRIAFPPSHVGGCMCCRLTLENWLMTLTTVLEVSHCPMFAPALPRPALAVAPFIICCYVDVIELSHP